MHAADTQARTGQTTDHSSPVVTHASLHPVQLAQDTLPANLVRLEDLHLEEEEVQGLADVVVELSGEVSIPPHARPDRPATLPDRIDTSTLFWRDDHPCAPCLC